MRISLQKQVVNKRSEKVHERVKKPKKTKKKTKTKGDVWFGLVWFYGISTILGYPMPNPFLYIMLRSEPRWDYVNWDVTIND